MFENVKTIKFETAGKEVEIETGKLARQATAAVKLTCGKTVLLVTVTKSKDIRPGIDFFPLMVDFEEKHYSVGKIPGGFLKREGRASDKAILVSRLIDRPVRPLFPEGYRNDVQINIMTLSVDQECPPDTLAMLGAGFALELAGLPMEGQVGAVRVCLDEDGEFIMNPSEEAINNSDLDIVVAGTADSIMMVEAGANFVEDTKVVDAIEFAHAEIKKQVAKIVEFAQEVGVTKEEAVPVEYCQELRDVVEKAAHDDLVASQVNATKASRNAYIDSAKEKINDALAELLADRDEDDATVQYLDENPSAIGDELKKYEKKLLRAKITEEKVRADGRAPDQVRPIEVETGTLPGVHGDGLFTRGNTQVLSILSLGTERECKYLDGIDSETEKFYLHNYNFPAWSVGEVRPNRGPGRREVGHGALAERAITPSLPSREDFPYTIRVVSEVLESSGSTSMGATCGSSLALMEGGVPVSCPVAGVAMGLIKEGDKTTVLTDIHELEDFLGDMDFKVAGNESGISALQMDIKIKGISMEILRAAIAQAKDGRLHILGKMTEVISGPNADLKGNAPRITSVKVPEDKIGAIIGSGGKNIKWIMEVSGAQVDINDDGMVSIATSDADAAAKAKELVELTAFGFKEGMIREGEVVKILENVGALVELLPGQSGLVHISQIAHERVNDVEKFVNIGDTVKVKVIGVDNFKGRISLSIKELLDKPDKPAREEAEAAA